MNAFVRPAKHVFIPIDEIDLSHTIRPHNAAISGGGLARWIKITTPNDRPHVIRVLETAASILRDELEARNVA